MKSVEVQLTMNVKNVLKIKFVKTVLDEWIEKAAKEKTNKKTDLTYLEVCQG